MIEKLEYLKTIKEILTNILKYPDEYEQSNDMAIICKHLATFCQLSKEGNYSKIFKKFNKLYEKIYDKNRRKLCRIEVLEDYKNAKFQKDPSIEGSRYVNVSEANGKKLIILARIDGTTVIEFWNTKIEVPTRIVDYLEELKKR